MTQKLPIEDVLPTLLDSFNKLPNCVLVAPPGAGKTTYVPLALLQAPWRAGRKIIMLAPRRLAARAAAQRMAQVLDSLVGEQIGYRVRYESRVSARTQVEVVTEGVFTRKILADPMLEEVACVIFDEFHERSLDADLSLSLALEAQGVLRPDLRLLVMSATLEGARVAKLLGDAPVVQSQGRLYPITTHYVGKALGVPLESHIGSTVRQAMAQNPGSVLVFLPGSAEINRTQRYLQENLGRRDTDIYPLYGALDVAAQQAALVPPAAGRRKVVLATAIAETSLTLADVRIVVDSGLARRARYESSFGLTRLVTERVSQAAAEQRRGRAGRLAEGICYRLWDEAETKALIPFDPPEILQADLTSFVLDLAVWGVGAIDTLLLLDAPPRAALEAARALLLDLGALDDAGAPTSHGKALASLPLHPRLAHMVMEGIVLGAGSKAAQLAALLSEPVLGGVALDVDARLAHFLTSQNPRAQAARAQAAHWARLGARLAGADVAQEAVTDISKDISTGALLSLAFPDRIAKARGGNAAAGFVLANGRGVVLDTAESLNQESFLVIANMMGSAERMRALLAARLSLSAIYDLHSPRIKKREQIRLEGKSGRVEAVMTQSLGAIVLKQTALANPSAEAVQAALIEAIQAEGIASLPWSDALRHWQSRIEYLHTKFGDPWPDVSDSALLSRLEHWLAPYLAGIQKRADIDEALLSQALQGCLTAELAKELDRLAPARFATPAQTSHAIDYRAPGGPSVALRVQELFGLNHHPHAGGEALTLTLLSPAQRPIQTTQDLPSFWRGSWAQVKAEMRGRYPRHVWPDDPSQAQATTRAKPRA